MPPWMGRPPRTTSRTFCKAAMSRLRGLRTACRWVASSTISTKARLRPRCGSGRRSDRSLIPCAQFESLDLARFGLWQAVDHLDFARIGMVAHHSPRDILNLLHKPRVATPPGAQCHIGLEDGALHRIRLADDGGFGDCGMTQDCAFDFERTDPVSRALDDIVGAALEPEISARVTARDIAGGYPSMAKQLTRALRIVPVAERVVALFARTLCQISRLSGRQLQTVLSDDGHLEAWHRQSHRAGLHLDLERVEIAEGEPVLARSEMIFGNKAERFPKEADDFGIERLAAAADAAQAQTVFGKLVRPERHHAAQDRRYRCQVGHAMLLQESEKARRRRRRLVA